MRHLLVTSASAALAVATASPAFAAPGLGNEVDGATAEKGEFEAESRYDTLTGGPDDGEDVIQLEGMYGVSDRLRLGVNLEIEREPGFPRKAEDLGLEAIWTVGRVGGIDVAIYGEYGITFDGTDAVETKLILQRRTGPWDLRFNLIAEKELDSSEPVELGYAASVDAEVADELRIGVQAFGELGTTRDFLPRSEHFFGPVIKYEVEGLGPELKLEAGYLFALSKAKDDTNGQLRIGLELEF